MHAGRSVDQQLALQVGIFFILFHIHAVLAGPDLPIHMPQVIPRHVLAVLPKFDRLAEIGTAVEPRKEPFDDIACPQFQPGDPLDRFRMQKSFGIGHRG